MAQWLLSLGLTPTNHTCVTRERDVRLFDFIQGAQFTLSSLVSVIVEQRGEQKMKLENIRFKFDLHLLGL